MIYFDLGFCLVFSSLKSWKLAKTYRLSYTIAALDRGQSHPAWVRGLKLNTCVNTTEAKTVSHPAWVRGLKRHRLNLHQTKPTRRTPRGCVD